MAAVLFGAAAPAASRLADSVPTFVLAGLLYVGAALAVAPAVVRRPPAAAALRAEWRPAAVAVVVGGAIAPLLLVAGLNRTSAATASILLNTELAATVVLAAVLFREHLGRRVLISAALVTIAGAMLSWERGAGLDTGALLIIAACACWGLDNGVTAAIEQLAPEHVVALKGMVAGGTNLAIGLAAGGADSVPGGGALLGALAIGAAGYGASITLWVKGARDLGAARAQVIFATAPFVGVLIAWTLLGDEVRTVQLAAVALAAIGVAVSLRSAHEHRHHHDPLTHEHEHVHDDGHHDHDHEHDGHVHDDHVHDGARITGRHSHPHVHTAMVHAHPHVPDLHHRHGH